MLPNSVYEVSIRYLNSKIKKKTSQENYRVQSLMNTDTKILNKILANQIQLCIKRPWQKSVQRLSRNIWKGDYLLSKIYKNP